MWFGKLIGGMLGYILLHGPLGVLLGIIVGNFFDRGYALNAKIYGGNQSQTQAVFFRASFQVMGHIAKADGQVSKREIQIVEDVMRRMNLNQAQRQLAIAFFNEGKETTFDLDDVIADLQQHLQHQRVLMQFFIEIQFQIAMAEGLISPNTKRILENLCQRLGVAPLYQRFEHIFRGGQQGYSQSNSYSRPQPPPHRLQDDYELFNLKPSCTEKELKHAYRRAMSQNHPDKLIAQGLPEEMIKLATEKTQRLQGAYERIRTARGW